MSTNFLSCTVCNEVIIKGFNKEVKIRAKVILVKENNTFAVCKGCDSEILLPLVYDLELAKSMATSCKPKLFLKK